MKNIVRETATYRTTRLYESKKMRIDFTEYKPDKTMDRIKFIRMANIKMNEEPEIITMFRYEDEQLIEDMLKMYGAE